MSNFLSRTSFGLDGQIRTFDKKDQNLQFAIFPVVGTAVPGYYKKMMEELEKYDLIFCAGSKSKSRSPRSFVFKLLTLRPDLGLVTSFKHFDIRTLKTEIVYADIRGKEFDKSWVKEHWWSRLLFTIAVPFYVIYLFFALNRKKLAKFYEPSGLPADEKNWEMDGSEEELFGGHKNRRRKFILDRFKEFFNKYRESDLKIAIVTNLSHAELLSNYLCQSQKFHVSSATSITIIEY